MDKKERRDMVILTATLAKEAPDLSAHVLADLVDNLTRWGRQHGRMMELACNEPTGEAHVHKVGRLRRKIAENLPPGFKVAFSGDPRGATVKLLLPSGLTNDWGREGYCVPCS